MRLTLRKLVACGKNTNIGYLPCTFFHIDKRRSSMMVFADLIDTERMKGLEHQAAEIRKLLLGALLMAKDVWREELEQEQEDSELSRAVKEAEEAFVDTYREDSSEKLENLFEIIYKRAKGLYRIMEAAESYKKLQ
jgi:hypothetical protein